MNGELLSQTVLLDVARSAQWKIVSTKITSFGVHHFAILPS
jgi:hypothetical protein